MYNVVSFFFFFPLPSKFLTRMSVQEEHSFLKTPLLPAAHSCALLYSKWNIKTGGSQPKVLKLGRALVPFWRSCGTVCNAGDVLCHRITACSPGTSHCWAVITKTPWAYRLTQHNPIMTESSELTSVSSSCLQRDNPITFVFSFPSQLFVILSTPFSLSSSK